MLKTAQMALSTFIDNVVILAVEMVLLKDLHELFTPSKVWTMNPRILNFVASEPLEEQQHRENVVQRLKKLEKAKTLCDDYQHRSGRRKSS